jgi:predicted phosphate transport protein (TIGR00153 family)
MADRIFKWFTPKRGEKVLKMVEEHLELTKNSASDLYRMIEASCISRQKDAEKFYQSISKLEMQADQLRRKMIDEITRSELFPEERDDLMELVRAVNWVANSCRESGRILTLIPFDKAPEEMKQAAQNICKADVDCVTMLANCVQVLLTDPVEALNLANEVELLEEEIDDLYSVARGHLTQMDSDGYTIGALILLNEFLDALETIADWCENTADITRAIAVRVQ